MRDRAARTIFAAVTLLFSAAGCREPGPVKNGAVMDCNYFWHLRRQHVCIKDMIRDECHALFITNKDFVPDSRCACDDPGSKITKDKAWGYVQIFCPGRGAI